MPHDLPCCSKISRGLPDELSGRSPSRSTFVESEKSGDLPRRFRSRSIPVARRRAVRVDLEIPCGRRPLGSVERIHGVGMLWQTGTPQRRSSDAERASCLSESLATLRARARRGVAKQPSVRRYRTPDVEFAEKKGWRRCGPRVVVSRSAPRWRSERRTEKSGRRSRPPASCRREQEAGVDEQRGAASSNSMQLRPISPAPNGSLAASFSPSSLPARLRGREDPPARSGDRSFDPPPFPVKAGSAGRGARGCTRKPPWDAVRRRRRPDDGARTSARGRSPAGTPDRPVPAVLPERRPRAAHREAVPAPEHPDRVRGSSVDEEVPAAAIASEQRISQFPFGEKPDGRGNADRSIGCPRRSDGSPPDGPPDGRCSSLDRSFTPQANEGAPTP